jgi:macrolide-specific efflux system membrane fusion protein
MKLKILAIVLLLVIGGGALAATLGVFPTGAAAATTYLTGTAATADVRDDVAATGTIAASTTWSLAFGLATTTGELPAPTADSGTWHVSDVTVKVGDTVTKNQVLATATNPDLAASDIAATNDRTAARLQLASAQDAYDAATTTDALRQTRSALLNATNAAAAADAKVADIRAEKARNKLIAPAAGIVTAVSITTGADAGSGAAITIDSTDYEVTASVVETDVAKMQVGQAATVAVGAVGATVDGTVSAIAPAATASTSSGSVVSYAVTVALTSPPATLRPGMTADVTITTASADGVLAVPAAAVRGVAGNYSVLVLTAAGTPQAQPVTVGLMTSSLVEIKTGLNAGDVVVTGTSSTQRTTTGTGAGGLAIPGGGGGGGGAGGFRGAGN